MNMNNPMFTNAFDNMNPEMLRNMSKMVDGMSDDQLKQMISRSGMGNIDPQFYRQQLKFMSSMSDKDLENMKNLNKSKFTNGGNQTNNFSSNNTNNNSQNNQNQSNNSSKQNQNSTDDILKNINETEYNKLLSIKNQGNELFKQGKYSLANEKYSEILNKIINIKPNKNESHLYQELEISSRLNIANCYINLNEYLLTVNECKKVLKIDSNNFKALYRCGIGYFNMNENELALVFFENSLKSKNITKSDEESVNNYLNRIKEKNKKDIVYKTEIKSDTDNKSNVNDILKNELLNNSKDNKNTEHSLDSNKNKIEESSDIKIESLDNKNRINERKLPIAPYSASSVPILPAKTKVPKLAITSIIPINNVII